MCAHFNGTNARENTLTHERRVIVRLKFDEK